MPRRADEEESFMSKVAGVTFTNVDGVDRQKVIAGAVRPGTVLRARREPDNPRDASAVGLWAPTVNKKTGAERWIQIGYMTSRVAPDVALHMDDGFAVRVVVAEVTGGGEGMSYGVNIEITLMDRPEGPAERPQRKSSPWLPKSPIVYVLAAGALAFALLPLVGRFTPKGDLRIDGSSAVAYEASLSVIRDRLGPAECTEFNRDLMEVFSVASALSHFKRASAGAFRDKTVFRDDDDARKALNGLTVAQVHERAANLRRAR